MAPSVIQRPPHETVLRLGISKAVDDVFRRALWKKDVTA